MKNLGQVSDDLDIARKKDVTGGGTATDVQVDSVSQVVSGTANLKTIGGDYNESTNKLATQKNIPLYNANEYKAFTYYEYFADYYPVPSTMSAGLASIPKFNLSKFTDLAVGDKILIFCRWYCTRPSAGYDYTDTHDMVLTATISGTNTSGSAYTLTNVSELAISGALVSVSETRKLAYKTEVDAKQDTLTFDSSPTQNSTNPVTSGGVYTALAGKADDNAVVKLTGNQTVAGIKTFSSPIRGSLQYKDSGGEYANLISGNGTIIKINEGDYEGIQDVKIWGKTLFFNDNCIGDTYHKLSNAKYASTTSESTTTWNVSDIIPAADYVSGAVYELYGQWHMYKTDAAFGYIWTDLWGNSTPSSAAILNTTGASRVAQTAFTIPASAGSAIHFKRSKSVSESYIYIFGYRRIK